MAAFQFGQRIALKQGDLYYNLAFLSFGIAIALVGTGRLWYWGGIFVLLGLILQLISDYPATGTQTQGIKGGDDPFSITWFTDLGDWAMTSNQQPQCYNFQIQSQQKDGGLWVWIAADQSINNYALVLRVNDLQSPMSASPVSQLYYYDPVKYQTTGGDLAQSVIPLPGTSQVGTINITQGGGDSFQLSLAPDWGAGSSYYWKFRLQHDQDGVALNGGTIDLTQLPLPVFLFNRVGISSSSGTLSPNVEVSVTPCNDNFVELPRSSVTYFPGHWPSGLTMVGACRGTTDEMASDPICAMASGAVVPVYQTWDGSFLTLGTTDNSVLSFTIDNPCSAYDWPLKGAIFPGLFVVISNLKWPDFLTAINSPGYNKIQPPQVKPYAVIFTIGQSLDTTTCLTEVQIWHPALGRSIGIDDPAVIDQGSSQQNPWVANGNSSSNSNCSPWFNCYSQQPTRTAAGQPDPIVGPYPINISLALNKGNFTSLITMQPFCVDDGDCQQGSGNQFGGCQNPGAKCEKAGQLWPDMGQVGKTAPYAYSASLQSSVSDIGDLKYVTFAQATNQVRQPPDWVQNYNWVIRNIASS